MQCAIGRAGAGKTTTMAAAREVWEAAGWRVIGAAIKGEAARTLGAATSMPPETLAWYLAHHDPQRAPLDARTVLVVDEASTISDRDLDRLGWLAAQTGATLRLIATPPNTTPSKPAACSGSSATTTPPTPPQEDEIESAVTPLVTRT